MPLTLNYNVLKEDKFDYPFRIFVSGSSQSGKTYFSRELLNNPEIFKKPIKSVRYCHPDYLTDLPVDWHNTLNVPVSYQAGIPSLDEMCNLEPDTCLVLDDLYEEAIQSRPVDYLFRVLSGKKNISVIIMSQRYFAHGRFGMNIRNNCNFTVMMRNSDGRVNLRIAQNMSLIQAFNKAVEDVYSENYYPYIFVDSSPRGLVSNYRLYTDIFSTVQTVFTHKGMKAYIINEHDFLANFDIINNITAKRKIAEESIKVIEKEKSEIVEEINDKTEPTERNNRTDGVDTSEEIGNANIQLEQPKRDKIERVIHTQCTSDRIQKRSRNLWRKRRLGKNLF